MNQRMDAAWGGPSGLKMKSIRKIITVKVYPFLVEICMGCILRSLQFCPWFQELLPKFPSDLF
jgi:hypothetical protein